MKLPSRRLLARTVAVLVLFTAVAGQVVRRPIPCTTPGVLLSLEFAATQADADRLAPPRTPLRDGVREAQQRDNWFIYVYGLLFLSAAGLVARRGTRYDKVVAVGIGVLTLLAGFYDWRENQAIVAALSGPPATGDFESPAGWAADKWRLIFLAAFALATPFLNRITKVSESRALATVMGLLLLAPTAIGAWTSTLHRAVELGTPLLALGFLLLALLCVWEPDYLN
jgi:hypothetical protein